jgi:prevent-host-death family protein
MTVATQDFNLEDAIQRVNSGHAPIVLSKDGKEVAVIMSIEEWEDLMDLDAVRRIKEEPGEGILWEDAKGELGLK